MQNQIMPSSGDLDAPRRSPFGGMYW